MKTKVSIAAFLVLFLLAACAQAAIPTPIPTSIPLDSDGDGMITPAELKVTFSTLHEIVKQIAETRPTEAVEFEKEITAFENSASYNIDIGKILRLANEILTMAKTINEEQGAK
jgi:hypothetical protein